MSDQQIISKILLTNKPIKHNYEVLHLAHKNYTSTMEAVIYYGFTPIKPFRSSNLDGSAARAVNSIDSIFGNPQSDKKFFDPKEKATLIKLYKNGHFNHLPGPIMLYQEKARKQKTGINQKCGLDIIGVPGSIAEALAIQATFAILEEEGFKDIEVELNSVGDKPSREAFERDMSIYVKNIINQLPEEIRELCKKNPYFLFSIDKPEIEQFIEDAPKPISYLTEESRMHLRRILEYLEELNIPYSINEKLIAHRAIHGHTIFRVSTSQDKKNSKNKDQFSVYGMRYSPLSRRLGYQKSTPAIGVFICYQKNKESKRKSPPKNALPKFGFVHLGTNAKLKSLKTIDSLRKNRIPICHYLTKDKLAGQMSTVERLKFPYIIIMGQKEALEGTVMIRNTKDYSQETICIDELLPYLKKINSGRKKHTNMKGICQDTLN